MDHTEILRLEQLAVKQMNGSLNPLSAPSRDVTGLEAMLDYAIVEGAQLRLPLFVCLLRLARMALREESEKLQERMAETHS